MSRCVTRACAYASRNEPCRARSRARYALTLMARSWHAHYAHTTCALRPRAQNINQLSGVATDHATFALLYTVLNLSPSCRMSQHGIHVATLVNEKVAKAVGMDEVVNGGGSSIGAQLRKLQHLSSANVKSEDGRCVVRKDMSVHATHAAADFPAFASMTFAKASTSAYRYDRKSDLDQRAETYGDPFSLVCPQQGGFKRLTYSTLRGILDEAAKISDKKQRDEYCTNHGIDGDKITFAHGRWSYNFALAKIPQLDWLNGNSHDYMHTSLLGTVGLEIGLQQFVFIRIRKYYTRAELNAAAREYRYPSGVSPLFFGTYVEEGRKGPLPDLNGKVKFTAAGCRHWLEHGTAIMESIFRDKVMALPSLPPSLPPSLLPLPSSLLPRPS